MQLAFLSLILIAVHVSVMVDCRLRHRHLQAQQHRTGSLKTAAHADASVGAGHFFIQRSRSKRKVIHRGLLVLLPVIEATDNFVSIFDLRRRWFICLDVNGELYKSRRKDRRDCIFQHVWLELSNCHVFYSTNGNWLIKLGGADLQLVHRRPPEATSALLDKLLYPFVRRQRRSEVVNPADPLRSESHPSHPVKDADQNQPEQDQTGAVSKETITSCDDPLRVLRSNGPGSPVKTNIADRAEH